MKKHLWKVVNKNREHSMDAVISMPVPPAIEKRADEVCKKLKKYPDLQVLYKNCFLNTITTTTKRLADGTTYVFTGDIPAMWLRDSSAQVSPYIPLANDSEIFDIINGLLKRQFSYILIDGYANAFNLEDNGHGYRDNTGFDSGWVWERKYEVDSLCYPFYLACRLYGVTKDKRIFEGDFSAALTRALDVFETEQRHKELSPYSFFRSKKHCLKNGGKGADVLYTGMTWSGFRPSDDLCKYNYHIPSNLFAAKVLSELSGILDGGLSSRCAELANGIERGVKKFGIVKHKKFGEIYAYETDGAGRYNLMDDANAPSLLSLPYLGCVDKNDPVYQNTRRFVLSKYNPYYFSGKYSGIGSPHNPKNFIWHISLIMQALTSKDDGEISRCLKAIRETHADKFYMHECFNKNDPTIFFRPWFAWANALFSVLIESLSEDIDRYII